MTSKKMFRWFWAWDDEKEEAWLSALAQSGWHMTSVSLPGFYYFEQGEPRDDVYRLDYKPDAKDWMNYLQLFVDSGWEYLGEMNSWHYFRKLAVNGERPEIFTDDRSKSRKYKRILLILVAVLPFLLNGFIMVNRQAENLFGVLKLILFLFMLLYIYGIVQLLNRLNQLKEEDLKKLPRLETR